MTALMLLSAAQAASDKVTWLDITAGLMIPVVVAVIPVGLAIYLHHREQRARRRDSLRDTFSEALRAVADYQELPYLIRRRSDAPPMTREELTRHGSDVQSRLDFYVARLELESQALGDAYRLLVAATRRESGAHMTNAWREDRIDTDSGVPLGNAYERSAAERERRQCLGLMRKHLGGDDVAASVS